MNTTLELKAEIMSLIGECTCHEAYTCRELRDPSCHYHDYKDSIEYVFQQYQGQERKWVIGEDEIEHAYILEEQKMPRKDREEMYERMSKSAIICYLLNCQDALARLLPPPPCTETEEQE